jgi:transposase
MFTSGQITQLKQQGWTRKKMADFEGVSERTIYRWNKRKYFHDYWHQRHGRKWGRQPKLTGENLKTFLDYADKNKDKINNQQELVDYASQLTGQPITRFIISRTLKKHEIRRKKRTYHYAEQSVEKIVDFQDLLCSLDGSPMFALDECSLHLGEVPRYGYAKWGSRIHSQRTGKRSSNYTLILCVANIGKGGVVLYSLIEGGMKTEDFHWFLSNLKINNEESYLIMDNVKVHHANQACKKLGLSSIRELLESKNIKPLYLPPYTPEMNPVEYCFNIIRHYVEKSKPRTYEELKLAVEKAIGMLDEKDMTKFFEHCKDYVPEDKIIEYHNYLLARQEKNKS